MIGDVAAAVRAMKRDPGAFEQLRSRQHVLILPGAAHGDDVRMVNDEQLVGDLAELAAGDEILLRGESVGVGYAA